MQNPWSHDDDDIPTNPTARARTRRLRFVGFLLWGVVISSLAVIGVSDTGGLTIRQALLLGALALGTAVVVLLLSMLARRLFGMVGIGFGTGGRLLFGLLFLVVLFAVLPPALSALIETVPVFDGIPVDRENPLTELLKVLSQ